jgi:hypothetical protein
LTGKVSLRLLCWIGAGNSAEVSELRIKLYDFRLYFAIDRMTYWLRQLKDGTLLRAQPGIESFALKSETPRGCNPEAIL